LIRDIVVNLAVPVEGKRVLLLGAGGAARGVVGPLLEQSPVELVIANRTTARANTLRDRFAHLGPVASHAYAELAGMSFDIVINATSASLRGEMPPLPDGLFAPGSLAYKMMYGLGDTPFRIFARDQGAARISEGLGMLVEQAAESFFVWRGVRPDALPVMEMLRNA
jgi:shikimate dehydrogenase